MDKADAIAAADAQQWAHHDASSEEEKEVKSEQESLPRTRPSAPRRGGRERSPRRRRNSASSSGRGVRLSASASSNLLAIAPIDARAHQPDEEAQAEPWRSDFARCMEVVQFSIHNLRHAERLSSSAAVAFATEATALENTFILMQSL